MQRIYVEWEELVGRRVSVESEKSQGSSGITGMTPEGASSIVVQRVTQMLSDCQVYTSRLSASRDWNYTELCLKLKEMHGMMRNLSSYIDAMIANGSSSSHSKTGSKCTRNQESRKGSKVTKVKINVLTDGCMPVRAEGGDWYDLICAEDTIIPSCHTHALGADPVMIPLGVAMEIPENMCAIVAPRSSTPKKHGIVMANSIGVIDNMYKGPNDEWQFPAYSVLARGGFIKKGTRIAQFTLIKKRDIEFVENDLSCNDDRGGFGSTGD